MKLLATLPDLRCQQRKGLKGRSGIGRIGVSPVLLPDGLSMRARLNDNEVRELCSAGRLHASRGAGKMPTLPWPSVRVIFLV